MCKLEYQYSIFAVFPLALMMMIMWYNYLVHLHISIKLGLVRYFNTCALGTNYFQLVNTCCWQTSSCQFPPVSICMSVL